MKSKKVVEEKPSAQHEVKLPADGAVSISDPYAASKKKQ